MKMLTVCALLCAMMALATAKPPPEEKTDLDKRTCCPCGWTPINGRCFRYIKDHKRWVEAEKYCILLGGNLASIHHYKEYHAIQELIKTVTHNWHTVAWIGGHDAVKEGTWLWNDGTKFIYHFWCRGEPNNDIGYGQHCIQINHSGNRCWDDDYCNYQKPFVCVRRR